MDPQPLWAQVAHLNGTLVAVERGRESWAVFEDELQSIISWMWEQPASELRDNLVEELRWAAEHAQNRRHDRTRDSLRRAAAFFA